MLFRSCLFQTVPPAEDEAANPTDIVPVDPGVTPSEGNGDVSTVPEDGEDASSVSTVPETVPGGDGQPEEDGGALVEPAVPQAETPHVCTVESGCLTLLCEHREGGAHSADCGYAEAVEGRPCGFVCPICTAAAGEISVTGWTWADEEKVLTEAGGR